MAAVDEAPGCSTFPFADFRDASADNHSEASDSELESSSRSPSPEPEKPAEADVKQPPFPFVYGRFRVRNMLPRPVLPRRLDPRFVAIQSPLDIPLCWLGVPFTFEAIADYAENTGLGVPVTEGYHSRIPGAVDLMKTWLVITDNFYDESGINIELREVWGHDLPIITFISNRQTCDITLEQHQAIAELLEDMGYKKADGPMWYLDKREEY